jgi:hypothetical protein
MAESVYCRIDSDQGYWEEIGNDEGIRTIDKKELQ